MRECNLDRAVTAAEITAAVAQLDIEFIFRAWVPGTPETDSLQITVIIGRIQISVQATVFLVIQRNAVIHVADLPAMSQHGVACIEIADRYACHRATVLQWQSRNDVDHAANRLVAVQTLKDGAWIRYPSSKYYDPDYPVKGAKTFFSGGGGLSSTAQDYATFLQMYLNHGELNGVRLLSRTTVRFMMANQIGDFWGDSGSYYGLAFGVERL